MLFSCSKNTVVCDTSGTTAKTEPTTLGQGPHSSLVWLKDCSLLRHRAGWEEAFRETPRLFGQEYASLVLRRSASRPPSIAVKESCSAQTPGILEWPRWWPCCSDRALPRPAAFVLGTRTHAYILTAIGLPTGLFCPACMSASVCQDNRT